MKTSQRWALWMLLAFLIWIPGQSYGQSLIQITSPGNNAYVSQGGTLVVTYTADASVTNLALQAGFLPGWMAQSSTPGVFTLAVPTNTPVEEYQVYVSGVSGGNVVASAPITVMVDTAYGIGALSTKPEVLQFDAVGDVLQLNVLATLSNGTIGNVTHSPSLSYTSNNTQVATVDSRANVTAVAPGKTFIAINGSSAGPYNVIVTVPQPATPAVRLSLPGGHYATAQSVTITSPNPAAKVYYTVNGSLPTAKSMLYTGPIAVATTTTINALAVSSGAPNSQVVSATYIIGSPAAKPTIAPGGGTYTTPPTVTLSDGTAGATIFYTLDGSLPGTNSNKYTAPIVISSSEVLSAAAIAKGYTLSPVATASFVIESAIQVPAPTFSPAAGIFTTAQSATIHDTGAGAVIHYTLDNSAPGPGSPTYSSPILVSSTETIKAIAIVKGSQSPVTSGTYTINTSSSQCVTIDYSKGFTTAGLSLNGGATVTNSGLQLTDGKLFEARSAFYTTAVPVAEFSTDFTFRLINPLADGITFTVQADGPKALGGPGGGLGYVGIAKSAAVKLDLFNDFGEGSNSVGLYFNGAYPGTPALDLTSSGINLHSGHVFAVHMSYPNPDGLGTITDTVTGVTAKMGVTGDLSKVVGSAAYVGFTGGTGALTATEQILTWSYKGGPGCSQ